MSPLAPRVGPRMTARGPALLAFAVAAATSAQAQTPGDRLWAEVGVYGPKVDSRARVETSGTGPIGTALDLEADLGLDRRESLPSILIGGRLDSRITVFAEYYALEREGRVSLARDINFDGATYPAQAAVESSLDSDVYRLLIGYSFIRRARFEMGAALGVHATDFEVAVAGEASVGNAGVQTTVRRRDLLAPLPTLGFYGSMEVAPRLFLGKRFDFMSLKIADYDGRLVNAQINLSYRPFDRVGVGIGYRHVNYRVDVEKERWQGRLRYKFSGPNIFLQVGFR